MASSRIGRPHSGPTAVLHREGLSAPRPGLAVVVLTLAVLAGCGTTRVSDSKRTATEQLLISDAIERAVMQVDLRPLAERSVYLDASFMDDDPDVKFLVASLRNQLLASGCRLAEKRDSADVIVEARTGAVGTDRSEVILGLPATSMTLNGNDTATPELAVAKRSEQRGVAKISLCAYERATGRAILQSGVENVASHSRARWFFGAGPFQDGEVHEAPEFAGRRIKSSALGGVPDEDQPASVAAVDILEPRVFAPVSTPEATSRERTASADQGTVALPPVR